MNRTFDKVGSKKILGAALVSGDSEDGVIALTSDKGSVIGVSVTTNLTEAEKVGTLLTVSQGDYIPVDRVPVKVLELSGDRLFVPVDFNLAKNSSNIDFKLSKETAGDLAATARVELNLFYNKSKSCN